MKTKLIFLFSIIFYLNSLAQGFQWVKKGGGNEADYGKDIAIDNNSNLYIAGFYGYQTSGTYNATFGTITISNTSSGPNGYLAKYDSSGTIVWVKNITGPGREYAYNVTTDVNGNIFIGGEFETTVTIDGVTVNTASSDENGAFIAKFLANGNLVWLKSLEPINDINIADIATDTNGDLLVIGDITPNTATNFFLRKYSSSNGSLLNSIQSVNSGISDIYPNVISVDNLNNIIVAGQYFGGFSTVAVGQLTFPILSISDGDAFVCKFNNSLSPTWLVTGGGDIDYDYPRGISIDQQNNIYISSSTEDTVFWGQHSLIKTVGSWAENYFVKLSSAGSILTIKGIPIGLSSIGGGFQYPIIGDKIFFSMAYTDTILIGNNEFSSTGNDKLILVTDTAINIVGAYEISGNANYSPSIEGLTASSNNDIYVTGSFRDLMTFGNIPISSTGGNKADMFLSKITPCILPPLQITTNGALNLCQGNSILISAGSINNANYQWYQNNIIIPNATASTYTVTQPGTYYAIASVGGACQTTSNSLTINSSSINAQLQAQPNVTNICEGDEIQILTTSIFATYAWSNGQNGISSITVPSGSYSVIVTDLNNCIDTAYITIGEFPLPQQPNILQSNCLLSSDITPANANYKWFFDNDGNGYEIVGNNNSIYNAAITGDGFYKLEIKDQNNCKNISNPKLVSTCGTEINEQAPESMVQITPNPTNGQLLINYSGIYGEHITLLLFNSIGQTVGSYNLSNGYNQLDLDQLDDGLYLYMIIINNEQISFGKIILYR